MLGVRTILVMTQILLLECDLRKSKVYACLFVCCFCSTLSAARRMQAGARKECCSHHIASMRCQSPRRSETHRAAIASRKCVTRMGLSRGGFSVFVYIFCSITLTALPTLRPLCVCLVCVCLFLYTAQWYGNRSFAVVAATENT